jgi:hypothetical protein
VLLKMIAYPVITVINAPQISLPALSIQTWQVMGTKRGTSVVGDHATQVLHVVLWMLGAAHQLTVIKGLHAVWWVG